MKRLAVICIFLFVPTLSLAADDADWIVNRTIEHSLESIYELTGRQTAIQTIPLLSKGLNRSLSEDEIAQLCSFWTDSMRKVVDKDEFVSIISTVYRDNFTPSELADIKKFYQTQTGRKLMKNFPALMAQTEHNALLFLNEKMKDTDFFAQTVGGYLKKLEEIFGDELPDDMQQ